MLCEERGFFLEIADLIRGLGLTILKGVMEAHNDKIWARFAVEVIPLHKGTFFLHRMNSDFNVVVIPFAGKQGCNKDGNIHVTRSSFGANGEGKSIFIQCNR